jgi:hypothetical protein
LSLSLLLLLLRLLWLVLHLWLLLLLILLRGRLLVLLLSSWRRSNRLSRRLSLTSRRHDGLGFDRSRVYVEDWIDILGNRGDLGTQLLFYAVEVVSVFVLYIQLNSITFQ